MNTPDAAYLAMLTTVIARITFNVPWAWRSYRANKGKTLSTQEAALTCFVAYVILIFIAWALCTAIYMTYYAVFGG